MTFRPIALAAAAAVLSLSACKDEAKKAAALERVREFSGKVTDDKHQVRIGWKKNSPMEAAEFQDHLSRLEKARQDAASEGASEKEIEDAEAVGADLINKLNRTIDGEK